MGTYPTAPRSAFVAWCSAHTSIFSSNDEAIGLTPAQALAFSTATTQAVAALNSAEMARQYFLATQDMMRTKLSALRGSASETVRSIRTFAENAGDSNVYVIAQIPPPAIPSPIPPPAKPGDLEVSLDPPSGAVTLRWKAANPVGSAGTSYIVRRRNPAVAGSTFEFIGVTGSKKFVDGTFIAGPDAVQYTVQGQRSDSSGPLSDIFTVNFGRAPGGGLNAVEFSGPQNQSAVKLAA